MAQVQSLAQELPHAIGAAEKKSLKIWNPESGIPRSNLAEEQNHKRNNYGKYRLQAPLRQTPIHNLECRKKNLFFQQKFKDF